MTVQLNFILTTFLLNLSFGQQSERNVLYETAGYKRLRYELKSDGNFNHDHSRNVGTWLLHEDTLTLSFSRFRAETKNYKLQVKDDYDLFIPINEEFNTNLLLIEDFDDSQCDSASEIKLVDSLVLVHKMRIDEPLDHPRAACLLNYLKNTSVLLGTK